MPDGGKAGPGSAGAEWGTYRRLVAFARPYAGRLVLGTLFGVLFAGSTTGMLLALKGSFARVFDPAGASFPAILAIGLLLPLAAAFRGIGFYLSVYFIEWVGNRVVMDLRMRAFGHIHRLPLGFFTGSRTGELISRVTNDTMQVERAVSSVLGDLVRQPFVLAGMVGFLIWLDARLAFVSLVLFPVCIVPVALFGRRVRRFAREGQEKLADLVSILQETITGARVVKAFGMEGHERQRFDERCRGVFSRVMRVTRAQAAIDPLIVFVSMVGLILVLLYCRWTRMTVDEFFSFAAALVALYEPVKKLSRVHITVQQSSAAADHVFELLDTPVTLCDAAGARPFEGAVESVEFEHASFAYGDEAVLTDVSFLVRAGRRVAVVGGSGAGKSTLVSLLPRFYDVTAGRVLINGRDLRDFTTASIRQLIGLVTQETILFNDTVAANIAYGRVDASREEIEAAARRAHAHDFIAAMPDGYDTVIVERGLRLSGGQCQRLAIARAILRNPPILILDEATSALDTESERQVQAALDEVMAGRTVFAIAHRLSTIMNADLIVVLDRGTVAEQGTHRELLAKGGPYQRLYDLQFEENGVQLA